MHSLCVMYSLSCKEKCVSDFTQKNSINSAHSNMWKEREKKKGRVNERVRASITLRHDVTFMRAITMMHNRLFFDAFISYSL